MQHVVVIIFNMYHKIRYTCRFPSDNCSNPTNLPCGTSTCCTSTCILQYIGCFFSQTGTTFVKSYMLRPRRDGDHEKPGTRVEEAICARQVSTRPRPIVAIHPTTVNDVARSFLLITTRDTRLRCGCDGRRYRRGPCGKGHMTCGAGGSPFSSGLLGGSVLSAPAGVRSSVGAIVGSGVSSSSRKSEAGNLITRLLCRLLGLA